MNLITETLHISTKCSDTKVEAKRYPCVMGSAILQCTGRHTWTQFSLIHGHYTLSGTLWRTLVVANVGYCFRQHLISQRIRRSNLVTVFIHISNTITRELWTVKQCPGNCLTAPCAAGIRSSESHLTDMALHNIHLYILNKSVFAYLALNTTIKEKTEKKRNNFS